MSGIGEAWRPFPARLRAEVLTRHYNQERQAPELEGWVWCFTLAEEGKAPSIRDTMHWTGWGSTKTKRVHSAAVAGFNEWRGEAATKNRKPARHRRDHYQDTTSAANAASEADRRPTARQARDHAQDDRARDQLLTTTSTSPPDGGVGGTSRSRSPAQRVFGHWLERWLDRHSRSTKKKWTKDEENFVKCALEQSSEVELTDMVEWAFHGTDRYARIIQGLERTATGPTEEHLGIETLFKTTKLGDRIKLGELFRDARNRPAINGANAPPPKGTWTEDAIYAEAHRRHPWNSKDPTWLDTVERELTNIKQEIANGTLPAEPPAAESHARAGPG